MPFYLAYNIKGTHFEIYSRSCTYPYPIIATAHVAIPQYFKLKNKKTVTTYTCMSK